ncbi:MAG: N-acetylmuramoyl-L-alanine amidase [Clostridia bacterium]|nr:N-acetylmuramoyl-L-alanine amidase [Clostridia bacterium]
MKRSIFILFILASLLLTACGDPASGKLPADKTDEITATVTTTATVSEPTTTPNAPITTAPLPKTTAPDTSESPETEPPRTELPETEPPETADTPVTDAPPVTEAPAVTEELLAMGPVPTVLEYADREILYTSGETPLVTADGTPLTVLRAGHAVIAVARTDETVTILYRGWLCVLDADRLTAEAPSSAAETQNTLGGIYYPAGGRLIAVDAGHQGKGMKDQEPLGPGSTDMKTMLSTGTAGVSTRIAERELNLQVSLLLRDELIAHGYSVMMIRESHEVTLSNAQRALIANAYGADAFVRVHANGSTNPDARGAMTICQTANNPYNGELYEESYALSECMLESYCVATGIQLNNIWMTDTMTGINWAEVPVTIMEMGYMSNVEEDELMATDAFRKNAAVGMANGLDAYFEWKNTDSIIGKSNTGLSH